VLEAGRIARDGFSAGLKETVEMRQLYLGGLSRLERCETGGFGHGRGEEAVNVSVDKAPDDLPHVIQQAHISRYLDAIRYRLT
jgi:hypothetical protein